MNEREEKPEFIKWFSEIDKNSEQIAGEKGANLGEIFNLKVSVPPGFVITTQAYDYFIEQSGIKNKIKEILSKISYENISQLNESTQRIRELIENSKIPKEVEEEIIEAYEVLGTENLEMVHGSALDILTHAAEPIFVAVRSSIITENLSESSFAGQQDAYLNIKGKEEILKYVKKCFASLFTSRATYYRNKKSLKHEQASLSVVIQKMIDSTKSGVIFSKDPICKSENIILEAVWGLGEGIVSGKITPDKYIISKELEILDEKISDKKIAITRDSSGASIITKLREEKSKHPVLKNHEILQLAKIALKLEEHYKKPQNIEFAIENDEIYILQTRPITNLEKRFSKHEIKKIEGEVILEGLIASPGIASGKVRIIEKLEDLYKVQQGDILVAESINEDMLIYMQRSSAIITNEGSLNSNAAIISRERGIVYIVETKKATEILKEGEIITVNSYEGKIYKGKIGEDGKKEILEVTSPTKIKIKVIVDSPIFAEHATKSGIKKVGLTKIEGIIAESGRHPNFFLEKNKIKDYEEIIFEGVSGIAEHFDEIWVRTSDIKTNEYTNLEGAPKEIETNPMLGNHGIRFSLKNPSILIAELNALKRISDKGTKIGVLLPKVISVSEIQEVKKIIRSINFTNLKIGVIIETPAAVQIIKEICEEGIDLISFNINNLAQYMLAVDKENKKIQDIYNEMHPAILYQIGYVIRVCKKYNVETNTMLQLDIQKDTINNFIEAGIDSISVNPEIAKDISDYIAKVEYESVKGTDKEPREYELNKEKTTN